MANRFPSHYPDIGVLGEEVVAQWLQSKGWIILHRRWRCRWGEIDIIARTEVPSLPAPTKLKTLSPPTPFLAFVEVKTRSRGNWDAGGLLSITSQKQAKIWQTARYFLATYPDLADYPCRFDVALVSYQRLLTKQQQLAEVPVTLEIPKTFQLGEVLSLTGYQMMLQEYIPSAFD